MQPEALLPRARALLASETIHPMLRALWAPRLLEAINTIEGWEREQREEGRLPLRAEISGETEIAGVVVHGKADRSIALPAAASR